ncbi:tRNA dihydrouridine synthase [Marinomonas ostreistagni]|uniref:tRNA dihydrouridine synthase n=1 Tax=Marinomonas ostreistagni TaxID=359209 RepID=UPI00194EE0CB|nr:tRNA-dihydrouridine synthase family protein [Marinomonas ostreistagni]MBM6552105.1 tRNA-dihydrouridine synthase family protein [Marinomonas ostreistagni]
MEGVMDHTMRALLSKIGGMDYLVSEFVRVTSQNASPLALKRLVPELAHDALTSSGHPVHVQLLGSNPTTMAATAQNAVAAGATHIDLNFGCPAKRVNGHGGGSFLLQEPTALFNIVESVRKALPDNILLSAKMRLGYQDEALFMDNLMAIEQAGAAKLTIHGRTKKDGYGPPARWEKIRMAQQCSSMEIIANGDIYDLDSLDRCRDITGCQHFMIGRGSLANPFIFRELKGGEQGSYDELFDVMTSYMETLSEHYDDFATLGRIKQWSAHLRRQWPIIADNLKAIRSTQTIGELKQLLTTIK